MLNNMYKDIAELINQHNLIEQAFNDFNVAVENWKKDSPKHYDKVFGNRTLEGMNVFVQEVSIRFSEWPECERQYVVITIAIFDNGCCLGDYNWMYPISDKALADDFLHILWWTFNCKHRGVYWYD